MPNKGPIIINKSVFLLTMIAFGALGATAACAQAPAPSPAAALRRVATTCKGEVVRFCPALRDSVSARDMLICLRPYRSDLSLGCRGAINAVGH